MKINHTFARVAQKTSAIVGSPPAFTLMAGITMGWILGGIFISPHGFSDSYQMPLNTLSSITTMLIAFLIQNTQNRDAKAIQLKLDELIKVSGARTELLDVEDCSDEELDKLEKEYEDIRKSCENETNNVKENNI